MHITLVYSPVHSQMIPNAYVVTSGHDVLRDDGLLYVKRLRSSGHVPLVYHRHYPHSPHAMLQFDSSPIIQRDLSAFLRDHPDVL